jgi:hypothetical protein
MRHSLVRQGTKIMALRQDPGRPTGILMRTVPALLLLRRSRFNSRVPPKWSLLRAHRRVRRSQSRLPPARPPRSLGIRTSPSGMRFGARANPSQDERSSGAISLNRPDRGAPNLSSRRRGGTRWERERSPKFQKQVAPQTRAAEGDDPDCHSSHGIDRIPHRFAATLSFYDIHPKLNASAPSVCLSALSRAMHSRLLKDGWTFDSRLIVVHLLDQATDARPATPKSGGRANPVP